MPLFHYTIRTAEGDQQTGEISATDLTDANARLTAQLREGGKILALEEVIEKPAVTTSSATQLSSQESVVLSENIANLTTAGLPLEAGLRALAKEYPRGKFQRTLLGLAVKLETGLGLEPSLKQVGAGPGLIAAIQVAHRSGNPRLVLAEYAANIRRGDESRQQTWLAISYSLVLVIFLLFLSTFFLAYCATEFGRMFQDFGTRLPATTRFLLWISNFLKESGVTLLVGFLVIGIVCVLSWKLSVTPYRRSSILHRCPFVGKSLLFAGLARFYRMLGLLIEHQIPLPEALTLAGNASRHLLIEDSAKTLSADVATGEPLSMEQWGYLAVPQLISELLVNPETLSPAGLYALADVAELRTATRYSILGFLLEPIVVVVCGLFLIFLVFAMFAPLFSLLNDLS